jgi:endonuclease/exonuclease/phosphatase family metal-dependent hydrolase
MTPLRIMTFNINGAATAWDDPAAWTTRAPLALTLIRQQAPDLIGLQEVEQGNLDTFTDQLTDYAHVRGNEYDLPPYAAWSSIFWRTEHLEATDAGEFWLSRTPDVCSADWGVPYPLGVTWVLLRCRQNGVSLLHLNTHFEDGPDGELSRLESCKLIVERVRTLQSGQAPAILTGDFNCNPDALPHRILVEAGWVDTYHAAGHSDGRASTFHGYEGPGYSAARYSGGANTYWRIDWILTRDAAHRLATRSCTIVCDRASAPYPSDHYPVVAAIDVLPAASA